MICLSMYLHSKHASKILQITRFCYCQSSAHRNIEICSKAYYVCTWVINRRISPSFSSMFRMVELERPLSRDTVGYSNPITALLRLLRLLGLVNYLFLPRANWCMAVARCWCLLQPLHDLIIKCLITKQEKAAQQ